MPDPTPDHFLIEFPGFDGVLIRSLMLDSDLPSIHEWFNGDYARFRGMQGKSLDEVRRKYGAMVEREGHRVLIGVLRSTGERIFMVECYRPVSTTLREYYDARDEDVGFHIIVAPPATPVPTLTYYAFTAIGEYLFSDPSVQRIVAEPDIRNYKALVRFKQAGYRFGPVLHLPGKVAQLVILTRDTCSRIRRHGPPAKSSLRFHATRVTYHYIVGRIIRKLRAIRLSRR